MLAGWISNCSALSPKEWRERNLLTNRIGSSWTAHVRTKYTQFGSCCSALEASAWYLVVLAQDVRVLDSLQARTGRSPRAILTHMISRSVASTCYRSFQYLYRNLLHSFRHRCHKEYIKNQEQNKLYIFTFSKNFLERWGADHSQKIRARRATMTTISATNIKETKWNSDSSRSQTKD